MKKNLIGKELIKVINNNYVGEYMKLDVNDVFWEGILEIREKRGLGTVYIANDVNFYIMNDKVYLYKINEIGGLVIEFA